MTSRYKSSQTKINKINLKRTKTAINNKAVEFSRKAKYHHKPGGSKNLSEFYLGCVHGMAVACNILNLKSEQIDNLLKELNEL